MELFDWDPLTGRAEYFDYDHLTGKSIIRTEEDVSPLLDLNRAYRNEGVKDLKLKDNEMSMRHYASIPMTVIMEWKQKGIDFFDKNDWPKVLSEIETNYPFLKVTNKVHLER